MTRYPAVALLTLALALTPIPGPTCRPLHDLYSPRYLHRLKTKLMIEIYETREKRLEAARLAVERRITVDELLEGVKASRLKQTPANSATQLGATCL